MLPARRWSTTARPFLVFLFFFAAGLAIASCRDDPTGPEFNDVTPRGQPRAESWSAGQGSLGTVSIPVPAVNDPNNGEVSWISTGMSIPDSTYVKVSLDGTISLSTHPDYFSITGNQAPYNGTTVGPWGITSSQLRVRVEMLDTAGATQFVYSGYPGTGADSSLSTVRKLNTGGSFRVMRKGVSGGASCGQPNWDPETDPPCWNGAYYWVAPGYNLSGAQNLQVETFDPFEFDDASGEIVEGATVTASATPHAYADSLGRQRWWYREGDTLSTPLGRGGVYLGTCANQSSCSYEPQEGGRFYFQARVYAGGTYYQEDVSGDPVLLRDYVFDFEPDTVIDLGDVTVGSCPGGSSLVAFSCTGGPSSSFENVHLAFACNGAERGSDGGCILSASAVPDSLPLDSILWRFVPDKPGLDTLVVFGDTAWNGILVTPGLVQASFSMDTAGLAVDFSGRIEVTDRNWDWGPADWQSDLWNPQGPEAIYFDTASSEGATLLFQPPTLSFEWGYTCANVHVADASCEGRIIQPSYENGETGGYTLGEVSAGPNEGLAYVLSADFGIHTDAAINPRLDPADTVMFSGGECSPANWWTINKCEAEFHTNDNGLDSVGMELQLDSFRTGVMNHEAYGSVGNNGHTAHIRMAAGEVNPDSLVESAVAGDTTALGLNIRSVLIAPLDAALRIRVLELAAQLHQPGVYWDQNFGRLRFYFSVDSVFVSQLLPAG